MRHQRLLRALPAHRPTQPLRLAGAEAGQRHRHLDHLLLKDDRPERVSEDRLERRVVVGHLKAGVVAQRLLALQVRVNSTALNRPRAHQRHLHGEIVEILGEGAREHLHLRSALDLEDAGRVRPLDRLVGGRIVDRDPREVDRLPAHPRDLVDAALDRGEHPQTQQVDLQEAAVGAGILVPLSDPPPLHRGGLNRADVDERPRGEHHPTRVLRRVTWQPPRLARQGGERPPPARARPSRRRSRAPCPQRPTRAGRTCPPSSPPARSRRAAGRAPCRSRAPPSASGSRRTPPPAPSAPRRSAHGSAGSAARGCRAGSRGRCPAPRRSPRSGSARGRGRVHRVDVREPGQVADDRADARAPPPAWRQQHPRRVRSPHLDRDLAGQLEDVEVQEEEAREPELPRSAPARPPAAAPPRRGCPSPRSDARAGARQISASALSAPGSSEPG